MQLKSEKSKTYSNEHLYITQLTNRMACMYITWKKGKFCIQKWHMIHSEEYSNI